MKLDTAKPGINAVWKNYQHLAIGYLIERGEDGATSGKVFDHCLFELAKLGDTISRASVIFFLNKLVDDGLASFKESTGKGGVHRIYSLVDRTWKSFNDAVIDKFLYKLWETFPDNEKIAEAIKQ